MSAAEYPYERVTCPCCGSDSSAYRTEYDDAGQIWQVTCFTCGHIVSEEQAGQTVSQLRHKCRVRYVLG